jgi:TonB family protein
VLSVAVVQSSGDPLFDEAAVSMIRRSDPVPRPPPEQADLSLKYDLDVIFNERSERKK